MTVGDARVGSVTSIPIGMREAMLECGALVGGGTAENAEFTRARFVDGS